jgi:hypothetical protein
MNYFIIKDKFLVDYSSLPLPYKIFCRPGDVCLIMDSDYYIWGEIYINDIKSERSETKSYLLSLSRLERWNKPRPIREYVGTLRKIKNIDRWHFHLLRRITPIDEYDYTCLKKDIVDIARTTAIFFYRQLPVKLQIQMKDYIREKYNGHDDNSKTLCQHIFKFYQDYISPACDYLQNIYNYYKRIDANNKHELKNLEIYNETNGEIAKVGRTLIENFNSNPDGLSRLTTNKLNEFIEKYENAIDETVADKQIISNKLSGSESWEAILS